MANSHERERLLYERLALLIGQELEFSDDQFSKYDVIDHTRELVGELKCRDSKYKRSYEDFLIEKDKYDFLMEYASKRGYRPLYINEHEGDVWIYALDSIPEPVWRDVMCHAHTHFGAQGAEKKMKQVGFLKWGQAARFYKGFIK